MDHKLSTNPLREIFSSSKGRSYGAFCQVMLLYRDLLKDKEFEKLCHQVTLKVIIRARFAYLLRRANENYSELQDTAPSSRSHPWCEAADRSRPEQCALSRSCNICLRCWHFPPIFGEKLCRFLDRAVFPGKGLPYLIVSALHACISIARMQAVGKWCLARQEYPIKLAPLEQECLVPPHRESLLSGGTLCCFFVMAHYLESTLYHIPRWPCVYYTSYDCHSINRTESLPRMALSQENLDLVKGNYYNSVVSYKLNIDPAFSIRASV